MSFQIQLGSKKNVRSVNVDQSLNIELNSSNKEILSYNESNVIDIGNLFNSERQESEAYRIYGSINFLSIINGLKKNYTSLTDFFTPLRLGDENNGLTKNLPFCFDAYLCYPLTATTVSPETFVRNYTVISKIENIEIYKAGFARNIFFNNIYSFDFNIDFNVEGVLDAFDKPINNLYLYFNYKPDNSKGETVERKTFIPSVIPLPYVQYNIGDVIVGDLVNYVNSNFEETLQEQMEYYVTFPYTIPSSSHLQFKYNPFIPIKIRDFGDEIISANISGGTESDSQIPSYAIKIDNKGNYIWKEILQNGYIDPINGKGVDFPFVNKRHYVFNTIVLPLKPDLNDSETASIFNDIHFNSNTGVYNKPATQGSLNNLGNKCA